MVMTKLAPRLRPAFTLLASLLIGASTGGCFNSGPRMQAPLMLSNPNERHPIHVTQTEATLDLAITNGNGLSSAQTAELRAYLRAYEKEGERLMVRAPSGGSNEAAAMRAFEDVLKALRQAGCSRRITSTGSGPRHCACRSSTMKPRLPIVPIGQRTSVEIRRTPRGPTWVARPNGISLLRSPIRAI